MNAFERIYDGIGLTFAKVLYFLTILVSLYFLIGLTCTFSFIVGGMLGYFSFEDFIGWFFWYVFPPLGFGAIVGALFGLIFLIHVMIGETYELLTGRNVKGVGDHIDHRTGW